MPLLMSRIINTQDIINIHISPVRLVQIRKVLTPPLWVDCEESQDHRALVYVKCQIPVEGNLIFSEKNSEIHTFLDSVISIALYIDIWKLTYDYGG